MSIDWPFADSIIRLGGADKQRIDQDDAQRQTKTASDILTGLSERPGVLLSDEVGMGKTFVAMAVAASILTATKGNQGPVVIMVPGRLRRKWQRDWEQFKRHCVIEGALDWIRDAYAPSPTEFFKLVDNTGKKKIHLVFMTTGCFSGNFNDSWIKLAMIRLTRTKTRLSPLHRQSIFRRATDLTRQRSRARLTEDVIRKLMKSDLSRWREILVQARLIDEDADDPIPQSLLQVKDKIDWSSLVAVLRESLPKRSSANINNRMKEVRADFNDACKRIYKQWLRHSRWHSPLLILDEAHHAKNDHTQLARLFRESTADDVTLLSGKFQRMLFLTATPFQLGHKELIRILESFEAIRWNGPRGPTQTRDEFKLEIERLETALDANRLAGRRLDRLWGRIRFDMLDGHDVHQWWERVKSTPNDAWEMQLVENVNDCRSTRNAAQELLRPWVVRHNRPATLPGNNGEPSRPRRVGLDGSAILSDKVSENGSQQGLSVSNEAALPFLLTARAQGELSQVSGARAFFAEGLSSSYEAFHHTRTARGKARDMDDNGHKVDDSKSDSQLDMTIVPTSWYERQISTIIPSRDDSRQMRLGHPKMSATVTRVVDLWSGGEKVLVFCFYRETCKALYEHIQEEIISRTLQIAGEKLGSEYQSDPAKTQDFLTRVARRFTEEGRPFYLEIREILAQPFNQSKYSIFTESQQKQLIEILAAYFRAPSFIARYLPLDDPDVQHAWEFGERRREVLEPGIQALRRGIQEQTDQSDQTFIHRVEQFLDFAMELAERSQHDVHRFDEEPEDEADDPLKEYLRATAIYSQPRKPDQLDIESESDEADEDDGSYRVVPLVRNVHGDTPQATRERLALAFNSPLFPEILISSSVMGEGIDLHRFCRHVIHYDGCWNPSTLEQQTGRLDRIRCKAEGCGLPIRVYHPFIAGGADEKMFRVVRDRERWFQIVMGQKFEFDERVSEDLASRVPLPETLARQLTFDLSRWKTN